jgi:hypothetical protein
MLASVWQNIQLARPSKTRQSFVVRLLLVIMSARFGAAQANINV